jgi:hypothetical protein
VFYVLEVLRCANGELSLFLPEFSGSFEQCFDFHSGATPISIRRVKDLMCGQNDLRVAYGFGGGVMEIGAEDFLGFDRGGLAGLHRKKLKA